MADVETWGKQAFRRNAKRINHPQSDDSRLHWGKILQWPMSIFKELDIDSIYFSFVLDLIYTEEWTGWGGLDDELKSKVESSKSNLEMIEDLAVDLGRVIKRSDAFIA